MHVRLFGVFLLFVFMIVVMTMRQFVMVMLVGMPIGAMLEFTPDNAGFVMMGDMVVVM